MDCRMYESEFPAVDDAVMVQVKRITPDAAYVSLLEYNNIEGMIPMSELSRHRLRSIGGAIKVGQIGPMIVLKVDMEKGHIDPSKRRISDDKSEAKNCVLRYTKSKLVHSIFRHVAETMEINLVDMYLTFGWPLYRKHGHAYEALKILASDSWPGSGLGLDLDLLYKEVRECLVKEIRRRMKLKPVKIQADIELKCFEFDGALHIQAAMQAAVAAGGDDDDKVKVKVVAAPAYVVITECLDKEVGIGTVNRAIEACKEEIERHGGKLVVRVGARVVSDQMEDEVDSKEEEEEE